MRSALILFLTLLTYMLACEYIHTTVYLFLFLPRYSCLLL